VHLVHLRKVLRALTSRDYESLKILSAKNKTLICLLGPILIGCVLLYFFDPHANDFYPKCTVKKLTGLNCPGCGSTRAVYLFLHGEFFEGFSRNPLLFIGFPVIVLLFFRPSLARKSWVGWTAAIVLVTYSVLRNIPVEPFIYLAP